MAPQRSSPQALLVSLWALLAPGPYEVVGDPLEAFSSPCWSQMEPRCPVSAILDRLNRRDLSLLKKSKLQELARALNIDAEQKKAELLDALCLDVSRCSDVLGCAWMSSLSLRNYDFTKFIILNTSQACLLHLVCSGAAPPHTAPGAPGIDCWPHSMNALMSSENLTM